MDDINAVLNRLLSEFGDLNVALPAGWSAPLGMRLPSGAWDMSIARSCLSVVCLHACASLRYRIILLRECFATHAPKVRPALQRARRRPPCLKVGPGTVLARRQAPVQEPGDPATELPRRAHPCCVGGGVGLPPGSLSQDPYPCARCRCSGLPARLKCPQAAAEIVRGVGPYGRPQRVEGVLRSGAPERPPLAPVLQAADASRCADARV